MDEYVESNRRLWDRWASLHFESRSGTYDLAPFRAGELTLGRIELEELGDVSGKRLLHLQCHFGLDTLSWARLGAEVTGVDFSERAIELARSLSSELDIPARFVRSDVYDLPRVLDERYDIVFTSGGVLYWLPDLERWGRVISGFLRPGGTFYIVEIHPFTQVFENEGVTDLRVEYPYFQGPEPLRFETRGSYAVPDHEFRSVEYGWTHPIGEVVTSLIDAGLRIEYLHEFPYTAWRMFPFMVQDGEGRWRLERGDLIPLLFSLRATKDS